MAKQDHTLIPMNPISRRRFLQYTLATGAALALPWATQTQAALAAPTLAKYLEALPTLGNGLVVVNGAAGGSISFTQKEILRQLHPQLPPTPLWAYDPGGAALSGQIGSFGMVIVAKSGVPLTINYTHNLPTSYPAWIPIDTRLTPFGTEVRVMTHLHGGFVAADSDGNPAATPNGFGAGQTQTVTYPNDVTNQRASLLWFHDHGLGATRLNVFAGLAGGYLIRDDQYDTGDTNNANQLPIPPYEIPLVIQDRQFNPDGTMLYPTSLIPGVTWIGEYFGNVMLVNGKVWPYLNVEPRVYRFRILNGCNARILNLDMAGASMWQIGAEGGMWAAPVPVKRIMLAPAERADVLVDFGPLAGKTFAMTNSNPPKPIVTPAPSLSQVMQFRVAPGTRVKYTPPATLLGGQDANLPTGSTRRFITLNEFAPETANWILTLNGVDFHGGVTETPSVGDVEDWYYINLTADTHPMHTHLFMHQVIGRYPLDVADYTAAAPAAPDGVGGIDPTPFMGPLIPPSATERGFKDTTMANPGQVTHIRGKFDLPGGVTGPQQYVYHCHIVEHEDNDMMRPFTVG